MERDQASKFINDLLKLMVSRGGSDLFQASLPSRLVYVLGAEGEGMSAELAAACDLRLSIPGSGAVELFDRNLAPQDMANQTACFINAAKRI